MTELELKGCVDRANAIIGQQADEMGALRDTVMLLREALSPFAEAMDRHNNETTNEDFGPEDYIHFNDFVRAAKVMSLTKE